MEILSPRVINVIPPPHLLKNLYFYHYGAEIPIEEISILNGHSKWPLGINLRPYLVKIAIYGTLYYFPCLEDSFQDENSIPSCKKYNSPPHSLKNLYFYHYGAEIPIEEIPFSMAIPNGPLGINLRPYLVKVAIYGTLHYFRCFRGSFQDENLSPRVRNVILHHTR